MRDLVRSRGLGDVYKRQAPAAAPTPVSISDATIDAIALRASTIVYRGLEETMRV